MIPTNFLLRGLRSHPSFNNDGHFELVLAVVDRRSIAIGILVVGVSVRRAEVVGAWLLGDPAHDRVAADMVVVARGPEVASHEVESVVEPHDAVVIGHVFAMGTSTLIGPEAGQMTKVGVCVHPLKYHRLSTKDNERWHSSVGLYAFAIPFDCVYFSLARALHPRLNWRHKVGANEHVCGHGG